MELRLSRPLDASLPGRTSGGLSTSGPILYPRRRSRVRIPPDKRFLVGRGGAPSSVAQLGRAVEGVGLSGPAPSMLPGLTDHPCYAYPWPVLRAAWAAWWITVDWLPHGAVRGQDHRRRAPVTMAGNRLAGLSRHAVRPPRWSAGSGLRVYLGAGEGEVSSADLSGRGSAREAAAWSFLSPFRGCEHRPRPGGSPRFGLMWSADLEEAARPRPRTTDGGQERRVWEPLRSHRRLPSAGATSDCRVRILVGLPERQ